MIRKCRRCKKMFEYKVDIHKFGAGKHRRICDKCREKGRNHYVFASALLMLVSFILIFSIAKSENQSVDN